MKLTINVDDQLFEEVMEMTGARNENELFQVALQHISAQSLHEGLPLKMGPPTTPEESGRTYCPRLCLPRKRIHKLHLSPHTQPKPCSS